MILPPFLLDSLDKPPPLVRELRLELTTHRSVVPLVMQVRLLKALTMLLETRMVNKASRVRTDSKTNKARADNRDNKISKVRTDNRDNRDSKDSRDNRDSRDSEDRMVSNLSGKHQVINKVDKEASAFPTFVRYSGSESGVCDQT
jgi:hypothetical protein